MKTICLNSLEEIKEEPEYPIQYVSSKKCHEGYWLRIYKNNDKYAVEIKYKDSCIATYITRYRKPAVWSNIEKLKSQLIKRAVKRDFELNRLYDGDVFGV